MKVNRRIALFGIIFGIVAVVVAVLIIGYTTELFLLLIGWLILPFFVPYLCRKNRKTED